MYNKVLLIVNEISGGVDGDGFEKAPTTYEDMLFCDVRSAGVEEHYEAERAGLEANYVFLVDTNSYQAVMDKYGKKYGLPDRIKYDGYEFNVVTVRPYRGRYDVTQLVGDVIDG